MAGPEDGQREGLSSSPAQLGKKVTLPDIDKAQGFANAIARGQREAAEADQHMRELMQDTQYLESLGFTAFGASSKESEL